MGMFDYVTHVPSNVKCCMCGESGLSGWQSKDGDCTLSEIPYWKVENFYTHCKCGAWNEFVFRTAPITFRPIEDYDQLSPRD